MKTRTILVSLAVFFAGVALCLAEDPNMGTWKFNPAKSKMGKGATRNETVVYAAEGDNVKITVDGVNAEGNPVHSDWTGKYDGKDYPVTGDPTSDARSYTRVNDRTLDFAVKMGGKTTVTGRVVVSANGKTRTVATTSTDASGKKVKSIASFDKQ